MARQGILTTVAFICTVISASAQVPSYPYPEFVPGDVIRSSEVNANFAHVADYALKRNGGGVITGHITMNADVTLDGVDISDFLLSFGNIRTTTLGTVGSPAFGPSDDATTGVYFTTGITSVALSGVQGASLSASGLSILGNAILNSSGKIPAISSAYFANLTAQGLMPGESSFADGALIARQDGSETISTNWVFQGTFGVGPTWNAGGTTFYGIKEDVTFSAAGANSRLLDVKINTVSKLSVDKDGKLVTPSFQVTDGVGAGFFMVSDASGNGQWVGGVPPPSGMLAFFESSCPAGWTIRSGVGSIYNNALVRGGASYTGVVVGTNTHDHSIDPPSTASGIESVDHTHTASPSGTLGWGGGHGHTLSGSSASDLGLHGHGFDTGWSSGASADDATPQVWVATDHQHVGGTTDNANLAHTHGVGSLSVGSSGDHDHSISFSGTTGGVLVNHTHNLDVVAFTSSLGDHIPAYIQVILCRKN